MPVQTRMSIQLDASLAPETEKASASAQVAGAAKIEPGVVRLTGELNVAPSGRTARDTGKLERPASRFHIDPSLSAEATVAATDAQAHPGGDRPVASSPGKRHQSGTFSPIEKDFFEREAELYKVENAESFADLEEKRAKASGKNGGKNGASTKPRRPHRK
jgi:hypothetical protein